MAFDQKDDLYSWIRWGYGCVRDDCFDKDVGGGFESLGVLNWEMGKDIDKESEKSGSGVDDVDDLLPKDPFNMNISATVTAISELLDDLEVDLEFKSLGFVSSSEDEVEQVDDQIFAGLNIILNGPMRLSNDDVGDLLPNDPFNMDISATFTAFSEFLEDLELKNLGFVDSSEDEVNEVDDQIFAGLNIILNSPLRLRPECVNESDLDKELHDDHIFFDGDFEEIILGDEKYCISTDADYKDESCTIDYVVDGDGGFPPDAMCYALSYLQVKDLLSVEMVCKSLRDLVQNDPLLWLDIHIDPPLSHKITDDTLVRVTNRAQGRLQGLTLHEGFKITNDSLKQVLENNPSLTKLSVVGCIKLKIDEFLCNLRVFKSMNPPGVKRLRVAGMLGLKNEHFEELKCLLGVEDCMQSGSHKPRFYRIDEIALSLDDTRTIDLETCPRCLNLREVYDCPAVSCLDKQKTPQSCRGCAACIPRCFRCGCCLSNRDYEENFFFYFHCLDSDKCRPDFQESATRISISPNHTYLHQQASYHFYLCG